MWVRGSEKYQKVPKSTPMYPFLLCNEMNVQNFPLAKVNRKDRALFALSVVVLEIIHIAREYRYATRSIPSLQQVSRMNFRPRGEKSRATFPVEN
jgi:hypothetical protein